MRGREKIILTENQIKEAKEGVVKDFGYLIHKEVADKLNVSYPTYLREKRRLGLDVKAEELTERVKEFEFEDLTEKDFFEFMKGLDEKEKRVGYSYFKYKFDESIILRPIADSHLGAKTTLHGVFAKAIMDIKKYSNTYTLLVGDYIDNYTKHSVGNAVYDQLMIPKKQKDKMEWVMKYLDDKVLGVLQGCHDEWSRKTSEDLGRVLSNISGVPYLGFRGILELQVGDNTYRIYCTHKDRWYSSDNLCHGLKKANRKIIDFDLGISAHNHIPNFEEVFIRNKMVKCLKLSSFKLPDRFMEKQGIPEAPILSQSVVLLAEEQERLSDGIIYFDNYKHALRFL